MKKITLLSILLLSSFSLIACSSNKQEDEKKTEPKSEEKSKEIKSNKTISSEAIMEGNISEGKQTTINSSTIEGVGSQNNSSYSGQKNTTENPQSEERVNKLEHYKTLIRNAKEKQSAYINSINDPKIKQSVQTADSAAIGEATRLQIENPKEEDIVEEALKIVIAEG